MKIESLVGDFLYLINNIQDNLSIIELKIGGNICTITNNLHLGMNEVLVSSCINSLTTSSPEIVLITENKIVSKKIHVKNNGISLSQTDCDALSWGDWIFVPGSSTYGTSNFCVMKYEAKEDSSGLCPTGNTINCPVSQAGGNPWVDITWNAAKIECESLGTGYHLITDNEWLTISRLAENDVSNWNSSVVGIGGLFRGSVNLNDEISCNPNAVLDGNTPGMNCPIIGGIYDGRNKRTLNISGNLIWDLSGNVWEWTDEWVYANSTFGSPYRYHGGNNSWMSYSSDDGTTKIASLVPALKIPSNGWNANQGMGRYNDGTNLVGALNNIDEGQSCTFGYCSPIAVFLRGGRWVTGARSGLFALDLEYGPSSSAPAIGFRCSYTRS